jgi:cation transport ATPase
MTTQPITRANRTDRLFFGSMALAMILTVFVGFAPSYYLRQPGAPPLTLLLQVHGFVATGWMLIFLAQTALVAAHRVDLHRRLGVAAVVLAAAFVVLTTSASIVSRGITPRVVFSAGAILMFVFYVSAGVMQRNRAEAHKRWMLLATISVLPPAIARMHLPFLPEGSLGPNLGGLVFLVPPFVYDSVKRGKIHPVTWWGGLFMVAMVPLRLFVREVLLR